MPLNIDWQQILLHMFNFVLLFAIFYLLLYRPVKKFMDDRERHYREMDKEATHHLEAAKDAEQDYVDRLNAVDKEIKEKREDALRQTHEQQEEILRDAKSEAAKLLSKTKEEAERTREKIVNSAADEVSKMVTVAAAKVVFDSTDEAFENFLDHVERSGNNAR